MTSRKIWDRERALKTVGLVFAAGAIALSAPAISTASPDDESGPTNPAVRDYLDAIGTLTEQVNAEAAAGSIASGGYAEQFASMTDQFRRAVLADQLPH